MNSALNFPAEDMWLDKTYWNANVIRLVIYM